VPGRLGVILGGDGGGLFVKGAGVLDVARAPAEGVIEVHRAAAREEEDVLHAEIDDELDDVVG